MKLIIAGGRDYIMSAEDYSLLDEIQGISEVVSGGARGADKSGEVWAKANNIPLKIFPADWDQYGRSAGYIRNDTMAKYADALAIFHGGKGSENMFKIATKKGLKIYDFRNSKEI